MMIRSIAAALALFLAAPAIAQDAAPAEQGQVEILPDITIDAPKAPQWLGDVLKALVEKEACSLAFLEGGAPAALTELGDEGTECWSKFKDYVAS